MSPNIAIIGAGPGGLCLANILQRNNISYTVFEGDSSPHERNQGGSLDLHPNDGQQAMKEVGLWEEFCRDSRPEADVMKIVRIDGEVLWDGNGPDKFDKPKQQSKPEIDREKLKNILLQNLVSDNLKFGMHVQEIVKGESNKWDLRFRNGSVESGFDLVIGAEGAWSKVRKSLSDVMPYYSGVTALELWVDNIDETNLWISQYLGQGSCFCFSEGRSIQMQRLGDGNARIYACLKKPEHFLEESGIDFSKPETARNQFVDRYFGDVGTDLQRVLRESNGKMVLRNLYMLPVGFEYEHKQGLTLLGDAAHLMTPFAGVGVNAALADALALGKTIVQASQASNPEEFDAAIQHYETEMFIRGKKFATKTFKGLVGHFSTGAAEHFAQRHRDGVAAMKAEQALHVFADTQDSK